MQVTETLSEELKREYKVVVPADSLNEKAEARLKEVASQVRIPGFRPGKIPMSVLKKRFSGHVMGEVLEQAAQDAVSAVIKDKELRPALQPKVEVSEYEPEGDFSLKIAVELLPDMGTPTSPTSPWNATWPRSPRRRSTAPWSGLRAPGADLRRSRTSALRKAGTSSSLISSARRTASPSPGGEAGISLELGSNTFIPGFDDALVGVRVGEQTQVDITFPGGLRRRGPRRSGRDLRRDRQGTAPAGACDPGRRVRQGIRARKLEGLKQAIRDQIADEYKRAGREKVKRRLLDKLADTFTPVPEGLVDVEFEGIWKQLMQGQATRPA